MEARSWTQPLAHGLADPDAFLHLRLRQADVWRTSDGAWCVLREAGTVELWSILGYLRWHGPELLRRDPDASQYEDADAYLTSRPLGAAIDAELARRAGSEPGSALACLRAAGVAPWELPARHSSWTRG